MAKTGVALAGRIMVGVDAPRALPSAKMDGAFQAPDGCRRVENRPVLCPLSSRPKASSILPKASPERFIQKRSRSEFMGAIKTLLDPSEANLFQHTV